MVGCGTLFKGRMLPACAALLALVLALGCSGGPSASGGIAIAGTRFVSVGDEVTFRLPASEESGVTQWALDSFDSTMLRLGTRPRLETGGPSPEWVVRFIARRPGTTQVSFRRTTAGEGSAPAGERRAFRIRISR